MSSLHIVVNGEPRDVTAGTTLRALLDELEIGAGPVAVERNGDVVPRAEHASVELVDGDVLEIVHFVGGG
jgi:sulfur carrier protein